MSEASIAVVKILFSSAFAFLITVLVTPILTHILYKYNVGKTVRTDTTTTPIVARLHEHKQGTPTMGGILIWGTTAVLAFFFWSMPRLLPSIFPESLNFMNRSETLLPLGALVATAIVGFIDDLFNIRNLGAHGGGLRMRHRLLIYIGIAVVAAYWFFVKLEWTILHLPFYGTLDIGAWIIPIFIFVIVATSFSVNETDGLDGLAGGVLLAAFIAYSAIAFMQGSYNLATFCAVISGTILAFLWFNIHPARFFMGDTGSMSLGVTLGIVAMLTDTMWLLPFIGFILVIESTSVIIQVLSKTLRRGKKIFRATPLHHHFEALGWPEPKVVMRFWIIAGVMTVMGLILFFIDRGLTVV